MLTKSCLTYREIFMEATKSDKIEYDCGIDPIILFIDVISCLKNQLLLYQNMV